jgi:hypothetical protein
MAPARGSLVRLPPAGVLVEGQVKWTDYNFFDGYLSHKSSISEICVWSMGHVHGIQVCFRLY